MGTFAPLFCSRDNEDVDDENDDDGVARRRRGTEFVRGPSLILSFTLNISFELFFKVNKT